MAELITEDEAEALELLATFSGTMFRVVRAGGDESAIQHDLDEMVQHIHALQNALLANVAARVLPGYRIMGERHS